MSAAHSFKYKGFDSQGKRLDGEVQAGSIDEAERRLSAQGVIPVSIVQGGAGAEKRESTKPASGGFTLFGPKRASDADVAAVLMDLSVMAETGVPFLEALDAIVVSTKSVVIANSLRKMRDDMMGGKSLSEAMRSAGRLFPEVVCEMVRVAEEGGALHQALATAAAYMDRAAELRKKVMNSMMYPIVMVCISTLTVLVLIVFVMPRFATIFSKMGAEIPITTKLMLSAGTFIKAHPMGVLLGAIALGFGLRLLFRLDIVRTITGAVLLRTPILGELLRKLAFSRAFRSIATLLAGNVSLMAALEHGANVAGNSRVKAALLRARSGVEHGGALSESLYETKVFPQMLIQMVAVGERTGRLAHLMASTATRMEDEVDARLKAMVSIIEPIMIVFMGTIVGTITLSIIAPIYSVVQNIK